jgi:hypothetical protein
MSIQGSHGDEKHLLKGFPGGDPFFFTKRMIRSLYDAEFLSRFREGEPVENPPGGLFAEAFVAASVKKEGKGGRGVRSGPEKFGLVADVVEDRQGEHGGCFGP